MVQQEHAAAAEAAAASEAAAAELRVQLADAAAVQEAAVADAAAAAEAELAALREQLQAAQGLQQQLGGEATALQQQLEGMDALHREASRPVACPALAASSSAALPSCPQAHSCCLAVLAAS